MLPTCFPHSPPHSPTYIYIQSSNHKRIPAWVLTVWILSIIYTVVEQFMNNNNNTRESTMYTERKTKILQNRGAIRPSPGTDPYSVVSMHSSTFNVAHLESVIRAYSTVTCRVGSAPVPSRTCSRASLRVSVSVSSTWNNETRMRKYYIR